MHRRGRYGDDVDAVCREAEKKHGIRCISVKSPGFSGNKSYGYKMASEAILELIRPHSGKPKMRGVNILGDFNLAGEMWIIQNYLRILGIPVVSKITGDATYDSLIQAPSATLNLVQCAGSMTCLANQMEEEFGIPFIKVSFFGREDTTTSLLRVAEALGDEAAIAKARAFCEAQEAELIEFENLYRPNLSGKKAAIYVGGGFKAISLIRQFNTMGIETVVVGTQTGKPEDYEVIGQLVRKDCIILDDANPAELETFMKEKGANITCWRR